MSQEQSPQDALSPEQEIVWDRLKNGIQNPLRHTVEIGEYTGDGVSTVFPIHKNPNDWDEALVYVDSIQLKPGEYTVANHRHVIFAQPPAANDIVSIRLMQTKLR